MKKSFADILKEDAMELERRLAAKVPQWAGVAGLEIPSRLSTEQCSSAPTARYKAAVACSLVDSQAISSAVAQRQDGPGDRSRQRLREREETVGPDGALRQDDPGDRSRPRLREREGPGVSREGFDEVEVTSGHLPLGETERLATTSARLADLTGGLGVDSWFFAQAGFTVCYNEMTPALAQAAEHNFEALRAAGRGAGEIDVSSVEVTPENISELLDGMVPDIVFMDPARRDRSGGKVFRIADCTPNVLGMTDAILEKVPVLMLKLSPMADISEVVRELDSCSGGKVTQVHVIGAAGECKELLVVMERGAEEGAQPRITVASEEHIFSFTPDEESKARVEYLSSTDELELLFEPGSALMKSGAYKLISERFGLQKFSRDVHLYSAVRPECHDTCSEQTSSHSGLPEKDLEGMGKWFEVMEVLPLGKASFREIAGRSLRAEVTARGLHISSEDLRKRLSIKSSDPEGLLHIFGVNLGPLGDHILITRRRFNNV